MTAARVGALFHIDPVSVLDEDDDLKWSIRVAAYAVVQDDRAKAAAAQKQRRNG